MNERIEQLAKQVGAVRNVMAMGRNDGVLFTEFELEKFAALVAAAEREACAKVVEILIPEQTEEGLIGHTIAKAIRERGLPPYTNPPVQEFVCSAGFCRFTLTQTGVGINVPDEEKCKK